MPITGGARRKGGRKSKGPRKSKPSMYQIARKVVNQQLVGDKTWMDTIQSATAVAYDNSYALNLCLVPQGSDQGNRMGDRIAISSIEINMQVYHNVSSTNTQMMGIALVHSTTNVNPTWVDLYSNDASDNVLSMRKPVNRGEYKVLKRWTLDLAHEYTADKATRIIQYRKVFKNPHLVQYNGAAATDGRYGQLCLVATSNMLNAAFPPQLRYTCRINYSP